MYTINVPLRSSLLQKQIYDRPEVFYRVSNISNSRLRPEPFPTASSISSRQFPILFLIFQPFPVLFLISCSSLNRHFAPCLYILLFFSASLVSISVSTCPFFFNRNSVGSGLILLIFVHSTRQKYRFSSGMGFFKNAVLLLYNTLLLIVHLVVFAHVTYSGLTRSFDYHKFFGILIILTCFQYFDIFLSLIRFTNSNPVVVFTQVTFISLERV